MNKLFATIAVLIVTGTPSILAQGPVPAGDDFQVNTSTNLGQGGPTVGALAGGGFVAVWESFGIPPQGQLYDADGSPVGTEFRISLALDAGGHDIAGLASGGFVVTWQSSTGPTLGRIKGRRFSADGTPETEVFQINSYLTGYQLSPAVASLDDGGFVVVWHNRESAGSDDSENSVQGRRFAADGTPDAQFQINSYTTGDQRYASVAGLADGGFVVVWQSEHSPDSSRDNIHGRRFAPDGRALGEELRINAHTDSLQRAPAVAGLADGGFVVAWESWSSNGTDSSGRSIRGRHFAADGTASEGDFQANSYTRGSQRNPRVIATTDGSFLTVWDSFGSFGSDQFWSSINSQRYTMDGKPLSGELQLNSHTPDSQRDVAAAALTDGGFVAVWKSSTSNGSDTSGSSVLGRRFVDPRFALLGLGDKCLDVKGADPKSGTPVNLYSCNGGENQRWRLQLSDHPQPVIGLAGKCLVPDGEGSSARVVLGDCASPDHLWRWTATANSAPGLLIHDATGLCLDVVGGVGDDGTPTQLFPCHGDPNQLWRPVAAVCTQDSLGLCLNQERFRGEIDWRSFDGTSGDGKLVPVSSDDSGLLWFFETDNWEMLVKVLDGCELNDRFWVYAAATTTVEYTLRVTDTVSGKVAEYFNPLGNAAAAITDTDAFATCSSPGSEASAAVPVAIAPLVADASIDSASFAGVCQPSPTNLCLSTTRRFHIEAEWRDYEGNTGSAQVVPAASEDSGLLWFFDSGNWEMLVKVLDACDVNGRFWMLAAATTDVEYTLRVTDTDTGITREYFNPLGNAAPALVDTFETCP